MKKKKLIFFLIVIGIIVLIITLILTGVITFDTVGQNNQTVTEASSVDQLSNGCYYVWHNDKTDNIINDLADTTSGEIVFRLCPSGEVNWNDDEFVNHTIWFTSTNDVNIPTLYEGDKLLYISSTYVPYEGISWERYADFGYTIGVANMVGDDSGHYRIVNSDGDGYKGYVYSGSDANELNQYLTVSNLFLDKIGGKTIRDSSISPGGTVLNLIKDKNYVCEWYTGTYYQDFKMKADIHTFGYLEEFETYNYEFLHSNCIEIQIPDWFKTGYYYVDGTGLFRYVTTEDRYYYNEKPYDANVDWNDPIILYDQDGNMIYDPSTGVDKRFKEDTLLNQDYQGESYYQDNSPNNIPTEITPEYNDEDGDAGVEEYEDIYNEIVVQ